MKTSMFKKALALVLCVWMICTIGFAALAASEEPYERAEAVQLSATTLSMVYGGTAKLTATVSPSGADQRVTWKSSDDKLVTVDANGNLTAAKDTAETPSGKKTVTITATSVQNPNAKAICTVTVDNDAATKNGEMLKKIVDVIKALIGTLDVNKTVEMIKQFFNLAKQLLETLSTVLPK